MSADIIRFPVEKRGIGKDQLGALLREAVPLPARDAELAMLVAIADHLVGSFDDDLCDSFLSRIAEWEAENRRS